MFKKGDRVHCKKRGAGTVVSVIRSNYRDYRVRFDNVMTTGTNPCTGKEVQVHIAVAYEHELKELTELGEAIYGN